MRNVQTRKGAGKGTPKKGTQNTATPRKRKVKRAEKKKGRL